MEVWDTDRGLPSSAVTSVVATPDGYLWAGTFEGLARFDGVRFTIINHRNTPDFPDDAVTSLLVDRSGGLWAGTGNGIAHRENGRWETYPGPGGAPLRLPTFMAQDTSGRILAVASSNRLYGLSGHQFVALAVPPRVHYLRIYVAPDGVWGSSESYFGRFRNDRWEEIPLPADLKSPLGTAPARGNGIWVAGPQDIRKYHDGIWDAPIPYPEHFLFQPPVTILEDSAGNLWAGDYRNGLLLFQKDHPAERIGRLQGLPNQTIRALFEGPEHLIWAATDGGGLVRFRRRTVAMFDESSGLNHSVVDTVIEEEPGKLLVGSYGGGLQRFDETAMQFGDVLPATGSSLTPTMLVLSLLRDSRGVVWAGTYGSGLFRIQSGRSERVAETATGPWIINALFLDSRRTLWAGYQRGLASYADGKLTLHNAEPGAPGREIVAIAQDAKGDLWAGGVEGLFHLHEGRFEKFAPPGIRDYAPVNALYADAAGSLWIAITGRGLDRLNGAAFTAYGPEQGLTASRIVTIIEDDQSRLWLGTQHQGLLGISRAPLDALAAGQHAQISAVWLTRDEGLETNQIRAGFQPASCKSTDGRLWFATLKGLAMVDPRQAWLLPSSAPVRIEEVTIGNRPVPLEQLAGGSLIVPPGSRHLQIVFTQPNFSDAERSRFQYRMEGLEGNWVDAPARSAAFDLSHGTYTFRVRAGHGGGSWSAESAALRLEVRPFFWETLWFRLAAVLSIIGITALAVYGFQSHKLKRKSEQLEREQALRRDIERMQVGLKVSEERFAKAFSSSPFPMTITTMDEGRFVDVNERFLERTGFTREEVIGQRREDLDLWIDPGEAVRFADAIRANKKVRNFEAHLKAAEGQSAWYLLSTEIIELDGQPCLLVASDDVTERRRLEEQLHQAQKLESIGRLAGGVAHDFNNLLTVINGYSDLVLGRLDSADPNWSRVDQIRKAGIRAAELTGQLLAFSRKQVIKPVAVDLNLLIRETEPMLRRLLPETIEIVLHLNPSRVPVVADTGQLHQVLINLAANARDAMTQGGTLAVSTELAEVDERSAGLHDNLPPGSYVLLSVKDDGAGMSEDVRKHVFEPFFTTKKKGAGTGLGLATVYGIVRQNGGWISVQSEPGEGARFDIFFPRVEARPETPATRAVPPAARRGRETILVVEDQANVRELACEVLGSYGYTVLQASHGAEALQIAAGHNGPIQLMLTDVVMPGMTGKELAARMKPLRPETKVLFMSGYNENIIAREGIIDSEIFFIAKPLSPDALAAKVREILGQVESA